MRDNKKTRIIPRDLQLAIRNVEELKKLLSGVTIAQKDVRPNIQSILLPKKSEETPSTALKASNPANLNKNRKLINFKPPRRFSRPLNYTKQNYDLMFKTLKVNLKTNKTNKASKYLPYFL